MKKKITTTFLLFLPLFFWGQVRFINSSFEDVVIESKKTGKFIFMQFEASTCDQCNEVADKAFNDASLAKLLQESFICFKVDPFHPDRERISSLYNIRGFGSYFIDQQKTLLHSYPRSSSMAAHYKEQIEIVFNRAGEELRLTELENQYKVNKTPGMLRMILEKRKSLYLQTDSLLDEYVLMLPADSAESLTTLVFVAQMAPILDSRADKYLRKNDALFNKAWYTMDLQSRIAINNWIIYKSRVKAIREKNETFAYRAATFANATHTDRNSEEARKTLAFNMLIFYMETDDTIKYIRSAVRYYDTFFMQVATDSLRKRDTILKTEAAARAKTIYQKTGDTALAKKAFSFVPISSSYSGRLTDGAKQVSSVTNDPGLLQKTLQWAIKANSFFESSESLAVWASILYKVGQKDEAIIRQKQSIALRQKQGYPTNNAEETLSKMTSGKF